ncbi:hypothetical protein B0H11DRAFT_2291182 [Mycena galericulata]|nr:hypothetical protein B0H11DRAFT_2291182 [Mycena galericulata]
MKSHSPIDALPVEILAYIFVLGTHEQADDECQPIFDSDSVKTPLVYASVSHLWRSVALNTPALYTSLCITPDLLRDIGNGEEFLDLTPIQAYLALSRTYLLDILIDARDQDWDFQDDADDAYTAPFSPAHMHTALTLLLPHLARWRSLCILTDVYAPMHAALRPFEAHLAAYGAPHLQTLRLMRCDAYAAHAPFSPVEDDREVFLAMMNENAAAPLLPALRHLSLRGVPAAWGPLASVLAPASSESASESALRTLELAYHPRPAQPTVPELAALLAAAPRLARLTLNGSGPRVDSASASLFSASNFNPSYSSSNANSASTAGHQPDTSRALLSLPALKALTLGYTSTASGLSVLRLLSSSPGAGAPNVRTLTLEDASDPCAPGDVDVAVGPLLTCLFPPSSSAPPNSNSSSGFSQDAPFPLLASLVVRRHSGAGAGEEVYVREGGDGDGAWVRVRVVSSFEEERERDGLLEGEGDGDGDGEWTAARRGSSSSSSSASSSTESDSWLSDAEADGDGDGDGDALMGNAEPAPAFGFGLGFGLGFGFGSGCSAAASASASAFATPMHSAMHPDSASYMHPDSSYMDTDFDFDEDLDEEDEDEEEAEAFKPGGVFDDPVFDARWGHLYGYAPAGGVGVVGGGGMGMGAGVGMGIVTGA